MPPLRVPVLDPKANVVYIDCCQCGRRRSAVIRDLSKRLAICTFCITENLTGLLLRYREERAAKKQAQAEARRAARRTH